MKKDIEEINVLFNNTAQQCFYTVCEQFEKSTASFNKWEHKTKYLRLHAMYLELMRVRLDRAALNIIEKHKDLYDFQHLHKAFTIHITRYINEFRFKYRLP